MSRERAAAVVAQYLRDSGLEFDSTSDYEFVVTLPGERKLKTNTSLSVGPHALTVNAFVARHPDENIDAVNRWLLERNRRLYVVSYALDHLGDIYLVGRLPLDAVTPDELDRVLGAVLDTADGDFNRILELGFVTAILREYEWRISRGEPTHNLAAFKHLWEGSGSSGSSGGAATH